MAKPLYPVGWWKDTTRDDCVDPDLWPIYDDFRAFLFVIWKWLNLPSPTDLQYDLANYLQRGPQRRMIQAFRGVGKSWITVAYVIWRLLRNPAINILVVSASKTHADNFTTFCLRLITEVEMCRHLTPREGQRQSKIAFDVGPAPASLSPSVRSAGVTGQISGSRADLIVPDDLEIPNNSETQVMRDKLSEAIKEFDAVLKPGAASEIVYLGTPQNEQSVYNVLPERGYEVRIWPSQYPDEKTRERFGSRLAPMLSDRLDRKLSKAGDPTEPLRFTPDDLEKRRSSYGKAGYALQYMLDTSLSDADKFPLKVSDLLVMAVPKTKAPIVVEWSSDAKYVLPNITNVALNGDRFHGPMFVSETREWADFDGTIMYVDPSGRGKDETAYAVVRFCQGLQWLAGSGGYLGGYSDQTLQSIAVVAKTLGVQRILVEPNFGDGMFCKLLAPVVHKIHADCTIEDADRAKTQKEARIIDTLEPVMMQHRLVIDPKVIEEDYRSVEGRSSDDAQRYRLIYQLTRVTRDKGSLVRDDRLDALAGAVAYWNDYMNQDSKAQAAANVDRLRDEALQDFMEHSIGYVAPSGGWNSSLRH